MRIWRYGVNGEDWIYPEAANTADPFRTYNDYFPIITDWSSWSKEDDLVFTANGFTSYHLEFRVYKQVDSSLSLKDIVLEKID